MTHDRYRHLGLPIRQPPAPFSQGGYRLVPFMPSSPLQTISAMCCPGRQAHQRNTASFCFWYSSSVRTPLSRKSASLASWSAVLVEPSPATCLI